MAKFYIYSAFVACQWCCCVLARSFKAVVKPTETVHEQSRASHVSFPTPLTKRHRSKRCDRPTTKISSSSSSAIPIPHLLFLPSPHLRKISLPFAHMLHLRLRAPLLPWLAWPPYSRDASIRAARSYTELLSSQWQWRGFPATAPRYLSGWSSVWLLGGEQCRRLLLT
jgi:hypothetical protein